MSAHSLILVSCLALASAVAQARELPPTPFPNAQHTHQAEAGSWELIPAAGFSVETLQGIDSSYKIDNFAAFNTATGEYGLNDMFSVGAQIGLRTYKSTVSNCLLFCPKDKNSDGVTDPHLYAKFKAPIGSGTIKASVDLALSLDKRRVNDSSNHSNQFTGGDTVTVALGYEVPITESKAHLLGARISYQAWKQERKTIESADSTPDVTNTYTGGANGSVEAYYEYAHHRVTYGTFLRYDRAASSYLTADGAGTTSTNSAHDTGSIGFYFPILTGGFITLYPQFEYQRIGRSGDSGVQDDNSFNFSFYARFVL